MNLEERSNGMLYDNYPTENQNIGYTMNEDSESSMQERSLVSREYEAAMSSTSSQLSVH
jgi:hypothetical protein